MKHIIVLILLILSIVTKANAEIVTYICNFKEGGQMEGGKEYPAKKMQAIKITLDRDKKLIRDIKRQFVPYTEEKDIMNWTHNWDAWSDKYSLNLANGLLEMNGENKSSAGWTKSYKYVCTKLEKKPVKN
jgi:hypothetical protein